MSGMKSAMSQDSAANPASKLPRIIELPIATEHADEEPREASLGLGEHGVVGFHIGRKT